MVSSTQRNLTGDTSRFGIWITGEQPIQLLPSSVANGDRFVGECHSFHQQTPVRRFRRGWAMNSLAMRSGSWHIAASKPKR